MQGRTRDREPEIPLAALEVMLAKGEPAFIEYVKDETGRSASAIKKALTGQLDLDRDVHELVLRDAQALQRLLEQLGRRLVRGDLVGRDHVVERNAETGLDVEIITSEKEAQLAFFSVVRNFALEGKNVAVADIGGGGLMVSATSARRRVASW